MKIGILEIQGDIEEHYKATKAAINKLNIEGEVKLVKKQKDIEELDGLIIPGGESTVIGTILKQRGLLDLIKAKYEKGLCVWGTCAGLIVMAKKTYDRVVGEKPQPLLEIIDVTVERNAYGRQNESFESDLSIPALGNRPFHAVFIRSPVIKKVGENVEVLAYLNDQPVAVQQGNALATTFHPELTYDTRFHEYFIKLCLKSK
jgi:5'-phosphate synthase pdxT subunit